MTDAPDRLSAALSDRYRIERELGEGGMASVYLAEDLRHHRRVAIKVLKPELAAVLGAERFLAEIETTANLQHPGILPLYDSGEADSFLYYVMPYVEGESLQGRLDREHQLAVDEAVRVASDVAEALEYAHGHGVVHRDVKPANILLLAGRPVMADFGIALAVSQAGGGRLTETGLSLGTPHYMSPEQATAEKEITSRADVYSLGAVLYEMLTGHPPHVGGSAQQIIMKIVTEQPPPVDKLRRTVPPNVAAAVTKALEKLPADRFETAKAFAAALANPAFRHGGVPASGSASGAGDVRRWKQRALALGSVAALATAALVVALARSGAGRAPPERPLVRFTLTGDPDVIVTSGSTSPFAVSPDGRRIVFSARTDTTSPQLWVRRTAEARAEPLPGTEGALNPAISPDGAWVAFEFSDGKTLGKVRVDGGDLTTITKLDGETAALSWVSNREIVCEQIAPALGIQRVDAAGGKPQLAIPFDSAADEVMQRRPLALGGDTGVILYASYLQGKNEPELVLYRPSDGRRIRLGIRGVDPLALIDGHLVYARMDGSLFAVRLDLHNLRVSGKPVVLEPQVGSNGLVGAAVGLSAGGTLVYRVPGTATASQLELVDTAGTTRRIGGAFTLQGPPRFSPDGRRIAFTAGGGTPQDWLMSMQTPADLWVVDVATGSPTRLTSSHQAATPSWFPNGRRLAYSARVGDGWELWSVPRDGSAPASRLVELPENVYGAAVVPGGESAVVAMGAHRRSSMVRVWLDGSRRADTLVSTGRNHQVPTEPRVSPDGRWIAYLDEQGWGAGNAWVRSLDGSPALQVSVDGIRGNPAVAGSNPIVWGPDSGRLYYESPAGLVEIDLRTTPTLAVLGRHTIHSFPPGVRLYDLSPDGKTFVVANAINSVADVLVALNWAEQVRQAWSAGGTP